MHARFQLYYSDNYIENCEIQLGQKTQSFTRQIYLFFLRFSGY